MKQARAWYPSGKFFEALLITWIRSG